MQQIGTKNIVFLLWKHDLKLQQYIKISVLKFKSGIFHSNLPNFVSHDANLTVKKGYIMISIQLRWCHKCWLIRSHCLWSKRAYVNLTSIASLMRRLKVLLSVVRPFVLLESTEWPVSYAVHLRTKINDNKMIFEFQKQDYRRRNHNKRSRNSSI